ncbi:MAG: TetR/AcrR family transcriptional regulator [Carbonactinosporaceae bacterium]
MAGTPTRRERLRAETAREIRQSARKLLVAQGPGAVSLRAIAREMGMTAPALYRYYASHEDLVEALAAELYDELATHLETARDAVPETDVPGRMLAACRALRRWALDHQGEFALLFATPLPDKDRAADPEKAVHQAGWRFGGVFFVLFRQLWQLRGFPVPDRSELDPRLVDELDEFGAQRQTDLPTGALYLFLACWTRLYGMVCMEVLDQLHFALTDVEPMFEEGLRDLASQLGFADHSGLAR